MKACEDVGPWAGRPRAQMTATGRRSAEFPAPRGFDLRGQADHPSEPLRIRGLSDAPAQAAGKSSDLR